ncbi:hypothetical protein [Paenibacillus agricola]|uniref:Uncharacterized protein n=1 Tax=Paenibacillus agricola TaxID=2716264 RepID=A0ABX0JEM2_9BACL|nr:hypothetical protein [Paenibacillus agricola]NHN33148.1 hypothetical protein [Paenibacillus agricola]
MKNTKIQSRGAAKIMEAFFRKGHYPEMKRLERRTSFIKEVIKTYQDEMDVKRNDYHGVIGKFVACNVYETDHLRLNDYLNDIGILAHVGTIDLSRLKDCQHDYENAERFKIMGQPYVKFNPNMSGRVAAEDLTYLDQDPYVLIDEWRRLNGMLNTIEKLYEDAKKKMMKSRLLKKEKKLSLPFGSVSLLDRKSSYDIKSIYQHFGESFLIQYGKVDMEQVDEFIAMGFLRKKELDQFRRIVDIQLRFVLLEKDEETKMYEFFHRRLQRMAKKSIAG